MLREIKHAFASLVRERSFTVVALLTLALAIGANTAIFSVLHGVLLKPLPYPEPDRLVTLYNIYPKVGVERGANGVPDYLDRRKETAVFEDLALLAFQSANLGAEGSPERVVAFRVTPTIFPLLRAKPALGRAFDDADATIGKEHVAILYHGLWKRMFGADPGIVGRDVRINGIPYTVVGVMPEDFEMVELEAQILLPFAFTPEQMSDDARHSNFATMLARLRPGVTIAQAQERIDALNQRNLDAYPQFKEILINAGFQTKVVSFQDEIVRDVKPSLYLLQAGVALVLLIGCVNVANLMLVRSNRRMKELAVRFALGAGRGRVARSLLVESVLLAVMGGALGLGVGAAGVTLLTRFGLDQIPRADEVGIDLSVMAFAFLLSLVTGLLFGLIPVAHVLRSNLATVFRDGGGRTGTGGRRATLTRSALVVGQLALACVLLVAAGLMLASFRKVMAVRPGFEADGVLTAQVNLPLARYEKPETVNAFVDNALTALRALPGVEAATATGYLPFGGNSNASVISFESYPLAAGENPPVPHYSQVEPAFFSAMKIPLVAGRSFQAGDNPEGQKVAIIDENLAKRYFKGNAVGQRLRQGLAGETPAPGKDPWMTIVGVVASIRSVDLADEDSIGTVYFPLAQSPERGLGIVLRVHGEETAVTAAMRHELLRLDPELPLYDVKTLQQRMNDSLLTRRAPMLLLAIFAAVALLLAAVGIYGVITYTVAQRTREIGIRSALGAQPQGVARLILWQGGRLIVIGLGIGLGVAILGSRLLGSLLFDVAPNDPRILAMVAGLLAIVAVAACLTPSLRAARVDPLVALRNE